MANRKQKAHYQKFRDVVFLNTFYIETRYPGDYPTFSIKEAKQAYEAALRVKDFVLEKIK